jgi:hypothetical protein
MMADFGSEELERSMIAAIGFVGRLSVDSEIERSRGDCIRFECSGCELKELCRDDDAQNALLKRSFLFGNGDPGSHMQRRSLGPRLALPSA